MELRKIETLTVDKISEKDGESNGRAWKKYGIITKEYGDGNWLGCFESNSNKDKLSAMREGGTVEVVVTKNGDYLNFSFPTYVDYIAQEVIALKEGKSDGPAPDPTEPTVDPQNDF